jgi:hypothetical protein
MFQEPQRSDLKIAPSQDACILAHFSSVRLILLIDGGNAGGPTVKEEVERWKGFSWFDVEVTVVLCHQNLPHLRTAL